MCLGCKFYNEFYFWLSACQSDLQSKRWRLSLTLLHPVSEHLLAYHESDEAEHVTVELLGCDDRRGDCGVLTAAILATVTFRIVLLLLLLVVLLIVLISLLGLPGIFVCV